MSSDYRMNLIWTSHGEQLRADLERNIGGLVGLRGEMSRSSRQMGLWGQQVRAIGTTIRYALAGAVTYGVATAVVSLGQFEAKLGDIDSLAAKMIGGNLQGLGNQISQVGDFALQVSNNIGVAAGSVEDSMMAFYSSFQPPQGAKGLDQMKQFVEAATELQRIGEGANPRALTDALSGMVYSFYGGNPRMARRAGSILAGFQQISVGYTGEAIARDVGRISGAGGAAGMTPEQVFGLLATASQKGGSTSVISRGVTQMLTNLFNPKSKTVKAAYSSIGLPTDPNALREFQYGGETGGLAILRRMMTAVGPVKATNRLALANEDLDTESALAASGLRGTNLRLAYQLFARTESLRQFLSILSRGPKVADNFIRSLDQAGKHDALGQRARLAVNQSQIQRAGIAQANLNMSIVRGFDPVIHAISRAMTGASNAALAHRDITTGAISGLAGASLASRVFLGAGLFGMAGRGMSRIPGVGRLMGTGFMRRIIGSGAGRAGDLAAASLVGSGLGAFSSQGRGTRADPMWVVIDPLSWFMPGSPSGMGGDKHSPTDKIPRVIPAWLRRVPAWARAAAAPTAVLATPVVAEVVQSHLNAAARRRGAARRIPAGHPLLGAFGVGEFRGTGIQLDEPRQPNAAQQKILDAFTRGNINANMAERRLRALEIRARSGPGGGTGAGFVTQVFGEAGMLIQFEATPELAAAIKDIQRRTHVPVKLWPAASGGGRPQHRGKNKTTRGQATR